MLLRLRAEQLVALLARRERPRERFVLRMFVASVSCVRSDRMRGYQAVVVDSGRHMRTVSIETDIVQHTSTLIY